VIQTKTHLKADTRLINDQYLYERLKSKQVKEEKNANKIIGFMSVIN